MVVYGVERPTVKARNLGVELRRVDLIFFHPVLPLNAEDLQYSSGT